LSTPFVIVWHWTSSFVLSYCAYAAGANAHSQALH
jgi:hypothetical protein